MSVHPHSIGWASSTVLSWRFVAQRFSFVLFLIVSMALLVLSYNQSSVIDRTRRGIVDAMAPVFDVVARPLASAQVFFERAGNYVNLYAENERLRIENEKLRQWQNAALHLEAENKDLRGLLHYKAEPNLSYISARVIADAGGPFVRSLLVTAGEVDGVHEGMAAMTGEGLVGRVVDVGTWSSRILLISDMNSKIPVRVTGIGEQAILAGDNGPDLKLLYMMPDAPVEEGMRVMTSGHGGFFPANLPVGVVQKISKDDISVVPVASMGRINQIRLVDFHLAGGRFNPMSQGSSTRDLKHSASDKNARTKR